MKPKEKSTTMNLVTFLVIIHLCFPLVVGAQHAILDSLKKLRGTEDNLVLSIDNGSSCPKKCVCLPQDSIKCSGLTNEDLIPGFFSGDHVTKIDLRQNSLEVLPIEAFQNLSNLKEMILSHNAISEVPVEILKGLGQLTLIDLSWNKISNLDSSIFKENTHLKSIDLGFNQISIIASRTFGKLSSLQKLDIQSNSLTNLDPNLFEGAQGITHLNLQSNRLTQVPIAIQSLLFLREIELSRNLIDNIPEGIFQNCRQIEEIELKRNPIRNVEINAFAHLPNLKKLIISEAREFTNFPNLNGTFSLTLLRIDRSKLSSVPNNLCKFIPNLKSLELKNNKITELPNLTDCKNLRLLDLARNEITSLKVSEEGTGPFQSLTKLHDLLLSHNNITVIEQHTFKGLQSLQILDLMANKIEDIHDEAFTDLKKLEDINLGMNTFSKFPSMGLKSVIHIKTHNNPNLKEFPGSGRFPKVQNLVLSYAYHCCQFIPSTYENLIPEYADFGNLKETIFFPGEGEEFDQSLWNPNDSSIFWSKPGSTNESMGEAWANFGAELSTPGSHFYNDKSLMFVTPPPGIQCMPAPGTFLPCNDLFDWWTLRCSIWIVFLLALLGNGCVVIVLVSSRGKMDVPRFLVCNLAAADFFMGLYLGFLAVVDASTLGEFRRYAIDWQFSTGCQAAGFFGVLSSELSVFTLAVITLERNYAITHAMHLNKRLSLRHAAYIMVAGWAFALITASMPLIGVSDYRKFAICLPFETGDGLSLGYVVFLTLINGVGFSILMGCYLKMYCAIRGSQAWNSNDSRIAKRMALLVFTDFICWFPIALFALTSCFGVHLISLDQAKVFTVFVLPLNSCFNPFLYAILTKQFKKDCVMICKAIEESRVTRGIGRCRHSSNFSNRQTPANTNSLNSGSGTHGSHGGAVPGAGLPTKGNICNCNMKKHNKPTAGTILVSRWPFNKLKKIFLGYKDSNELGNGMATSGSEYAQQIADIQHKQKTKRHASLSSENFSSSRSDSWRIHGGHHPQCLQQQHLNQQQRGRATANGTGAAGPYDNRRRNSWTVTRKPSQDSQLSSSRNDSNSSSNSTQTWRMSRSSVSSEMGNSRPGSGYGKGNGNVPVNAPIDPATGKLNMTMVHNQRINGGGIMKGKPPTMSRLASENSMAQQLKPKLIRQTAILPDGDSTGSAKSVKFQEQQLPGYVVVGGARRLISAAAEVGACPLHSHEKYKALYEKLAESSHEESDMEPSDAESDDGRLIRQQEIQHHQQQIHQPPPTVHPGNPVLMHRKLSTISSKDRDSKEEMNSPDSGANPQHEMIFSATADVIAPCDPLSASSSTYDPINGQNDHFRDLHNKSNLTNSHSTEEGHASPGPSLPVRSTSDNALAPLKDSTGRLKATKEAEEEPSAPAAPVITQDQEQSQSLLGHNTGEREVHIRRFLNTDI